MDNEKLKQLVKDTEIINQQLTSVLDNLTNIEDICENAENISTRASKAFKLYYEFIDIFKDEVEFLDL